MPPSEGVCSKSSWCPAAREGSLPKRCPFAAAKCGRQAPLRKCGEKMGEPWAGSVQWFPPYRWAVGVSCFFPVKIWGFCAYRSLQRGVLTVYLLGLNREELEVTAEGAASASLWEETGDQGGWLLKSTWQVTSEQPVRKRRVSQGYHCVFPLHPLGSTPQRGQIDHWQVLLIEVSKCWLWRSRSVPLTQWGKCESASSLQGSQRSLSLAPWRFADMDWPKIKRKKRSKYWAHG